MRHIYRVHAQTQLVQCRGQRLETKLLFISIFNFPDRLCHLLPNYTQQFFCNCNMEILSHTHDKSDCHYFGGVVATFVHWSKK